MNEIESWNGLLLPLNSIPATAMVAVTLARLPFVVHGSVLRAKEREDLAKTLGKIPRNAMVVFLPEDKFGEFNELMLKHNISINILHKLVAPDIYEGDQKMRDYFINNYPAIEVALDAHYSS